MKNSKKIKINKKKRTRKGGLKFYANSKIVNKLPTDWEKIFDKMLVPTGEILKFFEEWGGLGLERKFKNPLEYVQYNSSKSMIPNFNIDSYKILKKKIIEKISNDDNINDKRLTSFYMLGNVNNLSKSDNSAVNFFIHLRNYVLLGCFYFMELEILKAISLGNFDIKINIYNEIFNQILQFFILNETDNYLKGFKNVRDSMFTPKREEEDNLKIAKQNYIEKFNNFWQDDGKLPDSILYIFTQSDNENFLKIKNLKIDLLQISSYRRQDYYYNYPYLSNVQKEFKNGRIGSLSKLNMDGDIEGPLLKELLKISHIEDNLRRPVDQDISLSIPKGKSLKDLIIETPEISRESSLDDSEIDSIDDTFTEPSIRSQRKGGLKTRRKKKLSKKIKIN